MRRIVCYLVIHMMQIYGLNGLDCTESQLIVKQKYCDSSNETTLTMSTLNEESSNEIELTETILTENGCLIESDFHIGNNNTFYIECETEAIDCAEHEDRHKPDDTRNVFMVECDDVKLNQLKELVEATAKDLKLPILAGSTAAALGTAGLGFLAYKLKTVIQSGSYCLGRSEPPPAACSGPSPAASVGVFENVRERSFSPAACDVQDAAGENDRSRTFSNTPTDAAGDGPLHAAGGGSERPRP